MAETLLKCTTRHVRLFTAQVVNDDLVASDDQLTLDLDPDNEFLWNDASVAKVQQQFRTLVEAAGTGELSDYMGERRAAQHLAAAPHRHGSGGFHPSAAPGRGAELQP